MSVTARVTMVIEISVPSTWNPTTTMSQIFDQAKVDAIGSIHRFALEREHRVKIIGEPKVVAVMAGSDAKK